MHFNAFQDVPPVYELVNLNVSKNIFIGYFVEIYYNILLQQLYIISVIHLNSLICIETENIFFHRA